MVIPALIELFTRDLSKLKSEIEAYSDESKLWVTGGDIKNSGGNLCLHLTGNLKHFIGAVLGNSGYVREREKEFSIKDVPRSELIKEIEETLDVVTNTLQSLSEEDLKKTFPIDVLRENMPTTFFLIHLTTHLDYHLGQINYHRRLLDN